MKWSKPDMKHIKTLWKQYKSTYGNNYRGFILNLIELSFPLIQEGQMLPLHLSLNYVSFLSYYHYYYRHTTHIFLNSEVVDFLQSVIRDYSKPYLDEYPLVDNIKHKDIKDKIKYDLKVTPSFVLHFPAVYKVPSVVIFPRYTINQFELRNGKAQVKSLETNDVLFALSSGNDSVIFPSKESSIKRFLIEYQNAHDKFSELDFLYKIAISFGLFLKKFPNSLTAVSGKIFENQCQRGKQRVLSPKAYKFITNHNSLNKQHFSSPHWRSGHFRYLSSERYKAKRFSSIYVEGTFVKGKAKEVIFLCED